MERLEIISTNNHCFILFCWHMQLNNFKHFLMSAKIYRKNILG